MSHLPDEEPVRELCSGRFLALQAKGRWEYATRTVRRPAVAIVAITPERRLLLVEQFRPPVGRKVVELPAGLTGDAAGIEDEPLVEAARRELLEETGYVADQWSELMTGYSSAGLTDEQIVIFLAQGLRKEHTGGGVEGEAITVHEVPLDEVAAWIDGRGAAIDFKVYAGLFAALQRGIA